MVAVTLSWASDPVATAHTNLRNTNGDVNATLSSAEIPDDTPCVTSPHAAPGRWARYVGMVQDIWDTEMFVASSPSGSSGLLVEDCLVPDENGVTLSERLPVYLVSIPGATAWTRPRQVAPSPPNNAQQQRPQRSKRSRDEMDEGTDDHSAPPQAQPSTANENGGSSGPSVTRSVSAGRPPRIPQPAPASGSNDKRQRPGPAIEYAETPFVGLGLNLPLPDVGGSAVLAKIYDNAASSSLKVTSVVEVVGIFHPSPGRPAAVDPVANSNGDAFAEESIARNPMVPRLHVLQVRELKPWEINPAVKAAVASRGMHGVRSDLSNALPAMRELLLKFLASALHGDMIAAEYLLMTLLSRPATRTAAGATLGKLSLNLILPQGKSGDSERLTKALRALLPTVVAVPVNIAALNARDLYPRKDYVANRLRAAPLQLPTGACLIADETALCDGQLSERGVKNLRSLESVSNNCIVKADFQFYEAELPVDNSSVFLSRGGKSIVRTDVIVRVAPVENCGGLVPWEQCDADTLGKLRLAIGALIEDGEFGMADNVSSAVEQHFVDMRKVGKAKDGQESLSRWLSVARTSARTFGETKLTADRWSYAMQLESKRESYLEAGK